MALPAHPTTAATATTASTSTTASHAARPPFLPNPRLPPPSQSQPMYPSPFYHQMIHPHPPHIVNPRLPSSSGFPHPLSHDVSTPPSSPATTDSGVHYPVASSGRGFLQNQVSPVPASNANPNSGVVSYSRPLFGYPYSDPGQIPEYVNGRPAQLPQTVNGSGTVVFPGLVNGVPVASLLGQHNLTVSAASNDDSNGHKETRGKRWDESLLPIRGRKVTMSESASTYALCRSWLKNGSIEGNQLMYRDGVKLPRPLPLSAVGDISPSKKDDFKEEKEEEGSVEDLTPEELLHGHIKRAKRVRSRLREERLKRFARYKTRFALLLTPMVKVQLRNDSAPLN